MGYDGAVVLKMNNYELQAWEASKNTSTSAFQLVDARNRSAYHGFQRNLNSFPAPSLAATDLTATSGRDLYSEDGRGSSVSSKPISCRQFVALLQRRGIVPRL